MRDHVARSVSIGSIQVSNENPFVLFGGMNVLESRELAIEVADCFSSLCAKLDISFVFKASFDKANRSSIDSFRGPGMEQGLRIFEELKSRFGVAVITDVHEPWQAAPVAQVVDVIQLPAFLSRQTDLVVAIARTGAPVNIKKAQFLAPQEMRHIIKKCEQAGNSQLMLCERGSCFGYNNLVVDMLGFGVMKRFGYPLIFDVTHALQMPGARSDSAGGRRRQVFELGRAGMSQSIAGLFVEAHPNPDEAKCDGPCALPLDTLEPFLRQMKAVDDLVKRFTPVQIR